MANIVNAYALYNGTMSAYVGDQGFVVQMNCDQLQSYSPRPCWLLRIQNPGDGTSINYEITFGPSSTQLLDQNTLAGFWVEINGQDAMIDITTAAALQQACDACCGSVPTIIANNYGGNAPAFTPYTLNTFCIYRLDAGDTNAHGQMALDYLTQFVGPIIMKSHITGVSHYTITTFYSLTGTNAPQIIGMLGDVITNGACAS